MMSNFWGKVGPKMTPKNRTLEGKNRTLGGKGVKNEQKNQTSFMDVPLGK